MSYNFLNQLRQAAPITAITGGPTGSRQDGSGEQPTAAGKSAAAGRLRTDGGDEQSETEGSEDDESEGGDEETQEPQEGEAGGDEASESESEEREGADEEMMPPEQEGEAGVEQAEEEKAEEPEEEPEEAEAEKAEEEPEEAEEAETVDVPQSDVESVGEIEDQSTTVLFLDIYGLDLDLLGLELQLHQVVLDVFATEGDGNLLGNLLSAVAGLTDPGGLSDLMPEGGLSGLLPEGGLSGFLPEGGIKNALGLGGKEGQEGEEGEEGEGDGFISSAASSIRESVPSLPIKQLLIEIIAGVIRQLLESPDKESGEEATSEAS